MMERQSGNADRITRCSAFYLLIFSLRFIYTLTLSTNYLRQLQENTLTESICIGKDMEMCKTGDCFLIVTSPSSLVAETWEMCPAEKKLPTPASLS